MPQAGINDLGFDQEPEKPAAFGELVQEPALAPEVLFFGCLRGIPGHFLYSDKRGSLRYECTPWGMSLDGGLLRTGPYTRAEDDTTPKGNYVISRRNGWTCLSFWDRSGDSRPASNSAFLVKAIVSDLELIALARQQWARIFARPDFPLRETGKA